MIVGTADARKISHSPRHPKATTPASAFPAAACTSARANDAPTATIVCVMTHPARATRSNPQPGSPSGDETGQHGEEPGEQHRAEYRQQRRRIQPRLVRPQHVGEMLFAFLKL